MVFSPFGIWTVLQRSLIMGAALFCFLLAGRAEASVDYNIPPYYNATCNCCVLPGTVMHEIFWGTGLWTTPPDFQNEFYIDDLYKQKILVALQEKADQWRDIFITHAMMVGAFLDGQAELNALSSLQKLNATAMKDYQVSDQICRIGTLSRSLANSEDKSRTVKVAIMEQVVGRQLMKQNLNSGYGTPSSSVGRSTDKEARWVQLKKKFCDPYDINLTLNNSSAPQKCSATSDKQQNRDIDLTRTLDAPETLKLDFPTNAAALTEDEENVLALGNNLYAHDIPNNISMSDLSSMSGNAEDDQIRKLLDFRSVIAKRSVAANSFAAIASLKAQGGNESKKYLEFIAKELGLTNVKDIDALVGPDPSYNAQMDFLTRRIFQSSNFYANLYDTPANVSRQQAALEAIGLMQDRDIFESLQRTEMLLSTLSEMYVQREQDRYFNKGMK